jgi:hypothetical protein
MIQNIQIILNFNKKKFKIFGNTAAAAFPNLTLKILDPFKFAMVFMKGRRWWVNFCICWQQQLIASIFGDYLK